MAKPVFMTAAIAVASGGPVLLVAQVAG